MLTLKDSKEITMELITGEIRKFVEQQKLAYVATICPDGTPNLSPKGTIRVWDGDHVFFADIHSPGTVENLKVNPAIEINVVDIFTRKGYRLKGRADVLSGGSLYEQIMATYGEAAKKYKINNIVVVTVERVLPVWSPAYDDGTTEEEIVDKWAKYWGEMYPAK